jgi:hypothetical protein
MRTETKEHAMANYKAPLIKSLGEANYATSSWGGKRITFTHARKDGTRRVKLWLANDVFRSDRAQQLKLEAALKRNYGDKYLGGYFIAGARSGLGGSRSFCVVIKND